MAGQRASNPWRQKLTTPDPAAYLERDLNERARRICLSGQRRAPEPSNHLPTRHLGGTISDAIAINPRSGQPIPAAHAASPVRREVTNDLGAAATATRWPHEKDQP